MTDNDRADFVFLAVMLTVAAMVGMFWGWHAARFDRRMELKGLNSREENPRWAVSTGE